MNKTTTGCAAALVAAIAAAAQAQQTVAPTADQAADRTSGQTVVITGSVAEREAAEAPFAIGVVSREQLRDAGPQINLSEALQRVPGIIVANRSNYAQDLQVSSRGFGARAGFGVRGLRVYGDGIPATGPDGQGQLSQLDLAGADRVEVLRGPFSVLYGNASGGVIAVIGAPVRRLEAEAELDAGSFGLTQLRGTLSAPLGAGFGLRASYSTLRFDGFRDHSAARRELVNARLAWQQGADSVVLLGQSWSQPAQDPLGLTRQQFDADSRQVAPQAVQFDTRKDQSQNQVGASWKHRFGDGAFGLRELQLTGYDGSRSVTQWLAIPAATQASPRHGGGVVDLDRDYRGAEARLRGSWPSLDVQAGVVVDDQRDDRRGYENFVGARLGVTGALRRDEINRARSSDVYAQAEWQASRSVAASAGVRHGRVKLSADDRYLSNGDDSGSLRFDYTNPVAGLRWQPLAGWQLYASAARGFESPTLAELAYRADGTGGLNTALKAQVSKQVEAGTKWRGSGVEADLALFHTTVDDEIGVATNTGGRSAFQNVGRTRRRGAELSAAWTVGAGVSTRAALTWLDARYRDDFLTCAGTPCNAPTAPVAAGNRIAGTQRTSGYAEVAWQSGVAGTVAAEWRAVGRTAVNDLNSDFAAGYGVVALRWSWLLLEANGARVETLLRVDNVFDRSYAGSVIVNDGNARYFETGSPRALTLALRVAGWR